MSKQHVSINKSLPRMIKHCIVQKHNNGVGYLKISEDKMNTNSNEIQPTSLRGCILKSLEQGELLSGLENVLLTHNKMEVNQRDETEFWDFKEDIDLGNQIKLAQLSKWILAFHNAKGGLIIFGVTDKFKVVGIHESKIYDTVRLRNAIKKYVGPNVPIFQGRIEGHDYIHRKNLLWLIFIPKRENRPVPVAENGPNGADGIPIIQKGQYYIRDHDESKLCATPNDFDKLFSGVSFNTLSAYTYEIDAPFFRLLAPHQSQFVGRQKLLDEVKQALDSRGFIISLEGVGGVGKSALAIEIVHQLYKAKTYSFIISLSAKNKIWVKHTEAKQANFSGFTEMIKEIAKVLEIENTSDDINDLKQQVVDFIKGENGLLFIDNLEEIEDTEVFEFLKNGIPEPVKLIVTSRIDRNLPARKIQVRGMSEDEALTLLQQELERMGFTNYINEIDSAKEIVKAAGYLPLAIKWAASLASTSKSLIEVSTKLRKHDSTRKEFLDFCFATMYDELSENARGVALLCPYLRDDWNTYALSIALDQPVTRIEIAIDELVDRGILTSNFNTSFSMLPLTMDFLSSRWHENRILREQVTGRIADSFTSDNYSEGFFNWPLEERIRVLIAKSHEFEIQNNLEKSLKVINLALRWETDLHKRTKLKLIEGRLIFKSGEIRDGIELMQNALSQAENDDDLYDEVLFLAQALLLNGKSKEEKIAMDMVIKHIGQTKIIPQKLIQEFCGLALRQKNYAILSSLMENNKMPNCAYWITKEIWNSLEDSQILFTIGQPIIKNLNLSLESDDITEIEKNIYSDKSKEIKKAFSMSSLHK